MVNWAIARRRNSRKFPDAGSAGDSNVGQMLRGIATVSMASSPTADAFWTADMFSAIEIICSGVVGVDDNHIDMRISLDGSTFSTSATGYEYSGRFHDGTGNTNLNNNTSSMRIYNRNGANGAESQGLWIRMQDLSSSTKDKPIQSWGFGLDSSGNSRLVLSGSEFKASAGQILGVRLMTASGGNFAAGTMWVYGYVDPT